MANKFKNSSPSESFLLQLLFQIANALDYLYKNFKVSHRDIKSDNILIENDENGFKFYLSDFGSYKVMTDHTMVTTI